MLFIDDQCCCVGKCSRQETTGSDFHIVWPGLGRWLDEWMDEWRGGWVHDALMGGWENG